MRENKGARGGKEREREEPREGEEERFECSEGCKRGRSIIPNASLTIS